MLNAFKSFVVLAVMLGLLSGCSSNQPIEETDTTMEDDTSVDSGTGVDSGEWGAVDEEVDPLENVPTTFYFEFDSAVLKPDARAALTAHAAELTGSNNSVRLEGHADERGSREYNMALGERRANAVRDFLVLQGVSRSQIETVSYGEERPAEMGSSEYAWSQNRRVELEYE